MGNPDAHPSPHPDAHARDSVDIDQETVIEIEHAVPYYKVLTTNQADYVWAIDTDTKKAVSAWDHVDLKYGDKDESMPFRWVTDLQEDMTSFGYLRIARTAQGTVGEPDGIYGRITRRVIKYFQMAAKALGGGFSGAVNGIVDDDTKKEIDRWKSQGIRRRLRPFDPRDLLHDDHLAPYLKDRLYQLASRRDGLDLELYGPTSALDTFRGAATQAAIRARGNSNAGFGSSWHNYGMAVDMYLHQPGAEGPRLNRDEDGDGWFPEERMCYRNALVALGLRWGGEIPDFPHGDYGHTDAGGMSKREIKRILNDGSLSVDQRLARIWALAGQGTPIP